MHLLRRRLLIKISKLFDLLVMTGSFFLAAAITYHEPDVSSLEQFLSLRIKIQNFAIFLGLILAWHLIFSSFRLYNSRRLTTRRKEAFDVLKATSVATLFLILAAIIFRIRLATPLFIFTFWFGSSAIAISTRLVLRHLLGRIRLHGRNLRNILIVGTNNRAVQFAQKIESQKELGYQIIGFVDKEWFGIDEFQMNGYKLVADFSGFPSYIRNNVVDEVMIALPLKSHYQQASKIVAMCEEQGIIARYLSDIFSKKIGRFRPEDFEREAVIAHSAGASAVSSLLVKRITDIVVSQILLILLAPLFLTVALLIKRGSPGPVFFVQERVGVNKRKFRLYKFRTMIHGAEQKIIELEHLNEVSGPVFKIRNDPRITRTGKFLRKTSIDELPQLINVLKGDMSLVGPRPLPVRDYNGFDQDWHRRRFSVRPGITCLWQVNGRSDITFDKWMRLDMEYIDNWSLWLDFMILLKTFPAVLRGSGAA